MGQVHFSLGAEVKARLARLAVEGNEPPVKRADEDAEPARLPWLCFGIVPGGDASRGDFGVVLGEVDMGVILPQLLAILRIQRKHVIVWGAEE